MALQKILYDNLWSAAGGSLVASSEASALPAAASQNPDRTYIWRSLSLTANQTLIRDLGSSKAVDFVGLANVKLQNAGSVKLYEGGTAGSPGAWNLVATLPAQDADTKVAISTFNSVSARHWKLEWVNGNGGVADTAEVGYVGLGTSFGAARRIAAPVQLYRADPSVGRASVDGQATFAARSNYFYGSCLIKGANLPDMNAWLAMYRAVGVRTPWFFLIDSSIGWQQLLARFASDIQDDRGTHAEWNNIRFSWEEAR